MALKQCRLNANKTIREVAKVLDLSTQAVYLWERGESLPTPSNLVKLAGLYGCTVDDLLRREDISSEQLETAQKPAGHSGSPAE